jgi:catechol 2,3-dioxygenase-like lactoylglutathione lyase family enzyme
VRLNHVTLDVIDLERSKEFYRTLGLIQIVDTPPRYARFVLPEGDATLSVEVMGGGCDRPADRAQLYFECAALDERVSALKAKGLVFEQDPTDTSYLWREARLRDPDGHHLCLYFAGVNRLDPPWKLQSPAVG